METLKAQLYEACAASIEERIRAIEHSLAGIEEARNNETKSSAGDKYETGRTMMQAEADKLSGQLLEARAVKDELDRLAGRGPAERVEAGSLVVTDQGVYYILIGRGKITLSGQLYYCISARAPIAVGLIGKRPGEEVIFNGKRIRIEALY